MNKFILSMGALVLSAALAPAAWAVQIVGGDADGTDVGSVDIFIAETNNLQAIDPTCPSGSQPDAELCWAESVLKKDLSYTAGSKTENVVTYDTDTANVIAFKLAFGGGYYIIKNASWWALIENVASLDWGVVNTTLFNAGFNLKDGVIISHVTEFNNGTSVPEPGSLALLGLGLVGIGLARRRRAVA